MRGRRDGGFDVCPVRISGERRVGHDVDDVPGSPTPFADIFIEQFFYGA